MLESDPTFRSQDGRRYVDVEHPPGQYMRLSVEWTDRSPPLVPPSVGGCAVRLSVPALLEDGRPVRFECTLTPPTGRTSRRGGR